jgi:beta-galactosidase
MFHSPLPSIAPRRQELFDFGWTFHRGEALGAQEPGYDDGAWRRVDLPHDWSMEDVPEAERSPFLRFQKGAWKFHQGDQIAWKNSALDDSRWQTIKAPADWRKHSKVTQKNAWGWYRRELTLPDELKGRDFVLDMGLIGEVNEVFLNGRSLGRTGSFPPKLKEPDWWMPLSRYKVKAAWIRKDGPNIVAVRVFSKMGPVLVHCAGGRGGLLGDSPAGEPTGPFDALSVSSWATGYSVGGRGWYRKTFEIPAAWRGRRLHLHFDGIYMNARVWFNGQLLAEQPYGYSSFGMELPQPRWGRQNTVSVQVRNDGMNSRWYSGSGIYRHAWLTTSHPVHIAHRGIALSTPIATPRMAEVLAATRVSVPAGQQKVLIRTTLFDPHGKPAAQDDLEVLCRGEGEFQQRLKLENPALWSLDAPHLYSAQTRLYVGGRLVDAQATHFGVRSIDFSAEAGFRLNGQPLWLRGGCLHHDHGILGARAFDAAEERRVRVLKENGFNAVRTAHNPPSESFLNACDRQGLLVIDEAFDMWQEKTNEYDYHRHHARWWKRDLQAMVQRDRNHPSVLMWSIGNEVAGKLKPYVPKLAKAQADFVRSLDPSRPVTEGISGKKEEWAAMDGYLERHDVAGYNYGYDRYHQDHARVPGRILYQSESSNAKMFEAWAAGQGQPYVIGDFSWTGYDYIGEASIGYYNFDLRRGENKLWTLAYCGDLDLCGYKRPQSLYRETLWGSGPKISAVVHSPFPTFGRSPGLGHGWTYADVRSHWNWTGWEGKKLGVDVYTRCERVELWLNGKRIGVKKVGRNTRFMARFKVPYRPGKLEAVGFEGGKRIAQWALVTAGAPAGLRVRAERPNLKADGQDLAFVHLEVVDRQGRRVPTAQNSLQVEVAGAASLAGLGTGHPQNIESFQDPVHPAFEGRALLALRTTRRAGSIRVRVTSPGLKPAVIALKAR